MLRKLKERMSIAAQDILFDQAVANKQFDAERTKLDNLILSGLVKSAPPPPKSSKGSKKEAALPKDTLDDDSDSLGLLDMMDPEPETTPDGRVVTIREMGIPKQWSSLRTPKTLLRDCVQKLDKYAAISYSIISGPSRAVRASVCIVWDGKRRDHWNMDDVGCPNESQAEQYIATVALHALTYPTTDGFAAGSILLGSNNTFFRALPAAFRDLWDELEVQRKTRDDAINVALWSKLRALATEKRALSEKVCPPT